MKKILLSKILILSLLVSVTTWGQYTGSNPNVALSKTVLATDSITGNEPGLAVDDDEMTYASIPGSAPAWIQINLGLLHYVDGYEIARTGINESPLAYTFEASVDGLLWTVLESDIISTDATFGYDVVSADSFRYVRINMSAKDDPASFPEIRVFGEEISPPFPTLSLPASNITATGFTANWQRWWKAEGYAIQVGHDLNFTDRLDGYNNLDVGKALNLDLTGLTPGETYYYRVRTYNYAGTSSFGNTISVTTLTGTQDISFAELNAVDYGDADFELLASASSGLPVSFESSDNDIATIVGSTVTITGAGTVDITATQEGNDQYLPATPVVRSLVVNTVELVVTAGDASREECTENPDFTFTYAGFVGNEDATLLDTEPEANCSADASSQDGTYDIVVSGGSDVNYTFSYVSGTLTVNPDLTAPVLQVKNISIQLDENNSAEISPADLVVSASDECGIADTLLSKYTFGINDVGDVSVDVTVEDPSGNSTLEVAVVTVTGPNGMEVESGLGARIYPNPTYGRLNIELNMPADEMKVMDITGKIIYSKMKLNAIETVDLSEFNNGIYLIHLKSGEDVVFYKVVKE